MLLRFHFGCGRGRLKRPACRGLLHTVSSGRRPHFAYLLPNIICLCSCAYVGVTVTSSQFLLGLSLPRLHSLRYLRYCCMCCVSLTNHVVTSPIVADSVVKY